MEELGIDIPFTNLRDFGIGDPESFLSPKKPVIINLEFFFQMMEKATIGVIWGFLDSIQSGKCLSHLFKDVS